MKVGDFVKCVSAWDDLVIGRKYKITESMNDCPYRFRVAEHRGTWVNANPWDGRVYPGASFEELINREDKTELFQFLRAEMHG